LNAKLDHHLPVRGVARNKWKDLTMRFWILTLILVATLPACAEDTVKIGGVRWYTDYDAAMLKARERGVPLWLHFGENPG